MPSKDSPGSDREQTKSGKSPPITHSKKKCRICASRSETPYITEGSLVELIIKNNENFGSLAPHEKVKVDALVRAGMKIVSIFVAGYWFKIPKNGTIKKVCSGCGKRIRKRNCK